MVVLPRPAQTLAQRQFGVVARFQLLRWLRPVQVDGLVRHGLLVRLERGVYRVAGGAVLAEQRPVAAALRVRPAATVTGPFVLGHLRVDGFTPDDPFELLVSPRRELPRNVDFAYRRDPRPNRPVIKLGEVRLARPFDALLDTCRLRADVGDRRLRLAYDWLRWRDLIDTDRAARELARLATVDAGAQVLLEVLDGVGLEPESDGERRLGGLVRLFDPEPEPQAWVTPRRRVDWYFRTARCGWEYLGTVDHAHVAGRIRDDQRDAELRRAGIHLSYVTAADLADESALLATIAGTLTVRAHAFGVTPPVLRPA